METLLRQRVHLHTHMFKHASQTHTHGIPGQGKFCLGVGTVMQNGFTFETGTCLLYLFQGWIIDTRAKYMGACAGTFFAAVATQVSRADVWLSVCLRMSPSRTCVTGASLQLRLFLNFRRGPTGCPT